MVKSRKRPASALAGPHDPVISQERTPSINNVQDSTSGTRSAESPRHASGNSKNEIRFGKHLASSDKRVRDHTVSSLREWLHKRSIGGALTDLDLLKIWRGLWYCMFMCDKAPVQRELAATLTSLIHVFRDDRAQGIRFFRAFCSTMQRDWERIDKLRIDKYYTMVRFFVREAIRFCRRPASSNAPSPRACAASVVPNSDATSAEEDVKQAASPKRRRKHSRKGSANGASANGGEQVASSTTHGESQEHGRTATSDEGGYWDLELLEGVMEAMEEEIIMTYPAPIGLRLHLTDLWAEETFGAGSDMPTEAMLVVLSPWLRSLVDEKTSSVVFKRCVEGVFEWLLKYFPAEKGSQKAGPSEMATDDAKDEEAKYFDRVDLSAVQACIFEAASAPQTPEHRRRDLYRVQRLYQRRTGVAPDMKAPPSGIIPPPLVEDDDADGASGQKIDSEGEDTEYGVLHERPPRAVRGSEPPVLGWAAAGIASGEIMDDAGVNGHGDGKKRKGKKGKIGGESPDPEPLPADKDKKGRIPGGKSDKDSMTKPVANGTDGSKAHALSGRTKSRGTEAVDVANGDETDPPAKALDRGGGGVNGASKSESECTNGRIQSGPGDVDGGAASSVPKGVKSKRRRVDQVSASTSAGGDSQSNSLVAPSLESGTEEALGNATSANVEEDTGDNVPGKKTKRKKKRRNQGASEENTSVSSGLQEGSDGVASKANPSLASSSGTGEKSGGKKKVKEPGSANTAKASREAQTGSQGPLAPARDVTNVTAEPSSRPIGDKGEGAREADAASPSVPPGKMLLTPTKETVSRASLSARKTVTFGESISKDHRKSIKDLKRCAITPSKVAETPPKGLLKVGGGLSSEAKARVKSTGTNGKIKGHVATPYRRAKATDFF